MMSVSTRPVLSGPLILKLHDGGNVKHVCPGGASPRTLNPCGHWGTVNFHTKARTSKVRHRAESHVSFVTSTVGSGRGASGEEHATAAVAPRTRIPTPMERTLTGFSLWSHPLRRQVLRLCYSRQTKRGRDEPLRQSVPRNGWVHRDAPRINPAFQAPHLREARRPQDLERLHRAHAVVAVRDDLGVTVELAEALGQLAQRDQLRAGDARDLRFVRLPHVEQDESGV